MASVNGALSPSSYLDSANPSLTLSAKRKREDSNEAQNHLNGISSNLGEITAADTEPAIINLIDILKAYVKVFCTSLNVFCYFLFYPLRLDQQLLISNLAMTRHRLS